MIHDTSRLNDHLHQDSSQSSSIAAYETASVSSSGSTGGGAMKAIAPPPKRARKIFVNVSENKSSDRKLFPIPFVSSAFYVE